MASAALPKPALCVDTKTMLIYFSCMDVLLASLKNCARVASLMILK